MGDYDMVIKFKPNIPDDKIEELSIVLVQSGFETRLFPSDSIEEQFSKQKMIFIKYCDYTYLLKKAEELKLYKHMLKQYLDEEYFHVETSSSEAKKESDHNLEYAKFLKEEEYRSKKMEKFVDVKKFLHKSINRMEEYRKFKYSQKYKFCELESDRSIFESIFSPSEQLMIKQIILNSVIIDNTNLIEYYREQKYIYKPIPLHQKSQKPTSMSINDIRRYYGDNISIYFTFVEYFQKYLIPLAVIGTLVGLINKLFQFDSLSSPFDSIYSVIVIFWANYFITKWQKYEKQLKIYNCAQNTKQLAKVNKKLISSKKDSVLLINKIDQVTGEKYLDFPSFQRILRYLQSIYYLIPFIAGAIAFLIVSLNIRGFVDPKLSYIYIKNFYMMSQPGGYFDKEVWYKKQLATIIHVNVLQKLNSYYKKVVEQTSKNEVHSTHFGKSNSIVLKRFLFEMLYTFTDLSYIAFVQFDIESLKSYLISIYSVDEIRRVVNESIIPYFTKLKILKQQEIKKEKIQKKTDEQEVRIDYFKDAILELQLPKYEPFDDHLEIVINFGYITLFAASFPYAPLLVFIFNKIELYSDKHKIYYLYQRPQAYKISGIGIWNKILSMMSILCVFTNLILFSLSSEQITEFFPSLFLSQSNQEKNSITTQPMEGKGRYFVLVLFIIEHIMFIGIYLLRKYILSQEDWSSTFKKRKEYYNKIKYICKKGNTIQS